jgi:hypothetical protein
MLVEDENDGTLCLKRKSKSAMIWWKKEKISEGENSNAHSTN